MASKICNTLRYTSGFPQHPPMPSKQQIEETEEMMEALQPQVPEIKQLLQKITQFIPTRLNMMEIASEAIQLLRKKHLNVNIAKVYTRYTKNNTCTQIHKYNTCKENIHVYIFLYMYIHIVFALYTGYR